MTIHLSFLSDMHFSPHCQSFILGDTMHSSETNLGARPEVSAFILLLQQRKAHWNPMGAGSLFPLDLKLWEGSHSVTMQTGSWPLGAFLWITGLCGRTRFLVTGFQQHRGRTARALLLGVLLFHEIQTCPCSPKGYQPKPCPEVPHFLICP